MFHYNDGGFIQTLINQDNDALSNTSCNSPLLYASVTIQWITMNTDRLMVKYWSICIQPVIYFMRRLTYQRLCRSPQRTHHQYKVEGTLAIENIPLTLDATFRFPKYLQFQKVRWLPSKWKQLCLRIRIVGSP